MAGADLIDVHGFAPSYDAGARKARAVAARVASAVFLDAVSRGSRFYDEPHARYRANHGAWVIWTHADPTRPRQSNALRLHATEALGGRIMQTVVEPSTATRHGRCDELFGAKR